MSLVTEVALAQPLEQRARSGNRRLVSRWLRRLRILARLRARRARRRHAAEPGEAVRRDLGLDGVHPRSGFDFVDIHQGIESSRMRLPDTAGEDWRGL
jgi:hypothetical protein